ncbi:hypothetical protein [Endothiovibrio diazotrophicus]
MRRPSPTPDSSVSLHRDGPEWLDRIAGAARAEPWQVTLLKLAWTAGPATFLAASLGYYLGYGRFAPFENLQFFFYYTVVSGVVGLAAGIFTRATYGERRKAAEEALLEVVDRLPDLIAAVRDLHLESLEPQVRRLEAVGLLLQRVDLDSEALALAVEDLGAGRALAEQAAKIDIYRQAGLHSRVRELAEEAREAAQPVIAALAEWAPQVAALLRQRLNGHAPSFNEGVPRDSNFIERTLSAMEQEEERLMTLLDAEEMLVLACELINGRHIPMLLFTYRGRWELAQATDQLERRRNLYRIANATVLSRLKALVALLGDSDEAEVEAAARGLDATALLLRAQAGIGELNATVRRLGLRLSFSGGDERARLRRSLATLRDALELYEAMLRAAKQAGRRHAVFLHTIDKWGRTLEPHTSREVVAPAPRRRGLQVVERRIGLDDEARLELARAIVALFRARGIRSRGDRIVYRHGDHDRPLTPSIAKGLAMEVASALQPFVDISRPEIQRAIDASSASNLLGLETTLSARTKAAWGAAAAAEVEDDLAAAAERLAATLVTVYRVELSEGAIDFLHRAYGARPERLRMLTTATPTAAPVSSLQTRPPLTLPDDPRWHAELERSRQLLRRYEALLE